MRTRRLDADWDWTFGRSKSDYADTAESVEIRIQQILRCYTMDWFLDMDYGINYLGMMEKPVDWAGLETAIKGAILAEYGVSSIDSFDMDYNPITRHVTYTVQVNDIYHNTSTVAQSISSTGSLV